MTDTGMLIKMIGFVAIIATFTTFLSQWQPNGMTVPGWDSFITISRSDPLRGIPPWPSFEPPSAGGATPCDWWRIDCHVGNFAGDVAHATAFIGAALFYVGQMIFVIFSAIFSFLAWFFTLVGALFRSILSVASFTFDGMPPNVQTLLWVVAVPFWVLVAISTLRLVRGVSS